MFPNISLLYFFGPALLIASIFLIVSRNRNNKQNNTELNKAINHFKISSILFGGLLLILWLSLPLTPTLSTFGYPDDVSEIRSDVKLLHLLQEYNKAIVRTTEAFRWFLFLFIWWFLTTLWGVAKAYKSGSEKALAQHQL